MLSRSVLVAVRIVDRIALSFVVASFAIVIAGTFPSFQRWLVRGTRIITMHVTTILRRFPRARLFRTECMPRVPWSLLLLLLLLLLSVRSPMVLRMTVMVSAFLLFLDLKLVTTLTFVLVSFVVALSIILVHGFVTGILSFVSVEVFLVPRLMTVDVTLPKVPFRWFYTICVHLPGINTAPLSARSVRMNVVIVQIANVWGVAVVGSSRKGRWFWIVVMHVRRRHLWGWACRHEFVFLFYSLERWMHRSVLVALSGLIRTSTMWSSRWIPRVATRLVSVRHAWLMPNRIPHTGVVPHQTLRCRVPVHRWICFALQSIVLSWTIPTSESIEISM